MEAKKVMGSGAGAVKQPGKTGYGRLNGMSWAQQQEAELARTLEKQVVPVGTYEKLAVQREPTPQEKLEQLVRQEVGEIRMRTIRLAQPNRALTQFQLAMVSKDRIQVDVPSYDLVILEAVAKRIVSERYYVLG